MTHSKSRRILLGQIGAAHGIRGDVLVRTFTAAPDDIAAYGPLTNADGSKSFEIRIVRVTDKGVVARINGINDRTAAEALRGQELYVERSKLPATDDTEFYHSDLIGLAALGPDGVKIGKVVAVQNFGAGDLLEVKFDAGAGTEFVPFTNASVPDVDLDRGCLILIQPEMVGDQEPSEGSDDGDGGDGGE
jgi:16S rRNA processing protein RimM